MKLSAPTAPLLSLPLRSCLAATLLLTGSLALARASAPEEPKPKAVLEVMEKVADWQLANPSKHRPDDWTQAAGYTGIMALAKISESPRFEAAMRKMGEGNGWELGSRLYHADDQAVGQTYVELFLREKDPKMIAGLQASFDEILAHPKDDDLDFDRPGMLDKWSWCDALFMAPPAWTRLFYVTGKQAYLDYMVDHWWKTSDYLYDPVEHLYFRDSRSIPLREENGKKVFWSRGNGWVMAGLARVLDFMPLAHPSRPRFEQQFREMAAKIVTLQNEDGLWRASLLDPDRFPMRETSGSGFYCYALAWGLNKGYLEREKYEPAVLKAWAALNECVNPDGKLTHVQPIGYTPKTFDAELTEVYGVGAFLLAGSEVYRLSGGQVLEQRP